MIDLDKYKNENWIFFENEKGEMMDLPETLYRQYIKEHNLDKKQEEFTKYELIDKLTKIVGAKLPYTVMEEIIFNEQYNAKYIQGKKYKGFNVFIPKFDGNAVIGEPYEIHAKKGEARVISSINKDIGKLKIPKEHCDKFTLNHVTLEDEHN